MINRVFTKGIMTLAAAVCLLPAAGFASQIGFTLSGNSTGTSSYSGGVLTIDYTGIAFDGGSVVSGSYVEKYINSGTGAGTLTLTQTGGSNNISLTIDEAASLVVTSGASFSLYTASVSLATFNSAFLTDLGLAANPALANIPVGLQTINASVSGSTVVSSTMQMIITPEPSTFAMLGIALLSAIGYKSRKRRA